MVTLGKNTKGKLNKIYKKFPMGGNTPINPYEVGAAGLGLATPLIAKEDEVAGGVVGGALSGASAGSVAGPWGMAAGAVIGGTIAGVQSYNNRENRLEAERQYKNKINKQQEQLAIQRSQQTPANGNQTYSLTERKNGGKLSKVSNNTILATGATHEEGGIKLPELGAEVEDKETLKQMKDGGTYVMSDTLVNPTTGNTFAKDDLKLSKMKGRLEKINHGFGKNALTLLKNKEQKLVDIHEQVRQEEGLESADNTKVAKNGGMLKYPNGGKFTNTRTAFITKDRDIYPDGQPRYTQVGLDVGDPTFTSNKYYDVTDPKIKGKFMDNPDVEGIDGVAPKQKGSFKSPNLSKLTPYIDNITGAIYNTQRSKEKLPELKTLTGLNPNLVDYSQALKDTRDTTTAFNRGVDTTNVNQGNANIMKAFALGEQQKSIARISQEEANVNTGIKNEFAGRNKEIEKFNNEAIFSNAERNRLGRDEIRREGQQNIVDVNMKLQNQIKERNQEADDTAAELQFDDRTRNYISSKLSKRFGGKTSKLSKLKISY